MIRLQVKQNTELQLIQKRWESCTRCEIGKNVKNHVFWDTMPEGLQMVDVLFVGEGPGMTDDIKGLPFVGAAGKLLRQTIIDADPLCNACLGTGSDRAPCEVCHNQKRALIGFTNLLLCRPYTHSAQTTGNRAPLPEEVFNCMPRLADTVRAFNPSIVVMCGKEPDSYTPLLRDGAYTSNYNRLQWTEQHKQLAFEGLHRDYAIRGFHHPSWVVRQGGIGSTVYKEYVKDMKKVFVDFWNVQFTRKGS